MRSSALPWFTTCAAFVIGMSTPAIAQNYFDYNNANGLTPTGTDGEVIWNGNYWQSNPNPNTTAPGAFVSGAEVYFSTGGVNQLSLSGPISVYDIYQTVAGTQTTIGGAGTITLEGENIENTSGQALTVGRDVILNVIPAFGDFVIDAMNGSIVINGQLQGNQTIQLNGNGGIELNGDNSDFNGTLQLGGLVIVGSNHALGGTLRFSNTATVQYARGVVADHSSLLTNQPSFSTFRINTNGNNLKWNSSLGTNIDLVKTGDGRLELTANQPSFNGKITIEQGILALGNGLNPTGTTADNPAQGIEIKAGGTLDISAAVNTSGYQLVNEYILVSGHGVGNLGAIMNNSGSGKSLNRVHLAGHSTINANTRFDFDSVMQANGYSITKIGTAELPFEGNTNIQNIGNLYIKQGIVTFTGSSKMGDPTKTVYVNSNASLYFYNGPSDTKKITLKGGNLSRNGGGNGSRGSVITVADGLKLEAGSAEIRHGNSQLVYALGNIQRQVGATLNVANTSGIADDPQTGNPALATTTLSNTNEILGGWLVYGGNTWATSSGSTQIGTSTNVITGLGSGGYATNDFTVTSNNVDVTTSTSAPAGWTVNTLRFNTAGATTLTLSGTNNVSSGGILVTSAVGSNNVTITGGTLRGSASGDLIIHQNNGSGQLIISSVIADNSGATALTKSGIGVLSLRTVNSYTGNTYINGSPGGGTRGILDVNDIRTSGNDNLGSTSNTIYFNNGTLRYSNASQDAELARQINLLSGGGAFDVSNTNRTLRLTGKISGEALAADEGHFYGQGNLIKEGTGVLEISNGSNDYTGETIVNNGILRVVGSGRLGAGISRLTVNANGILELNGTSQQMGLLMGSAGGIIRNGSSADSVLSIGHDDATYVASNANWGMGNGYAGSIQDGAGGGKVSLEKHGVGYQILSGVSTYTGTTTVHDGFLQVGSGTAATSTAQSGSGLHTVKDGATLAGNGIVGGNVLVEKGGVLSVGNFGQTAAQTLTIDGGLESIGNISLDLWTHSGTTTTTDQLRFDGDGNVTISGDIVVNHMLTAPSTWASGESIKFINWGSNSSLRSFTGNLDVGTLALADEANTYWDTRRMLLDGVIIVRDVKNAFIWDSNTGASDANDGNGTWNTTNTNWINSAGSNASFVNGNDVWIGQNNGTANATITVDNSGGITVRDITFDRAGTSGSNNFYYTIAGGTAANNVLTLENGAMVTTAHALEENLGTTISTRISGTSWLKSGEGRLILTGDNNFTGDLNVIQGVLDIRSTNALGTTAGKTIVHGGAQLTIRGPNTSTNLTIAENLELNGYGINNDGALRNQAQNNTFSGTITFASDTLITSREGNLTLSGVINGAGDLNVRTDSGTAFVFLTGGSSNTFTGNTYVRGGTLVLGKSSGVNAIAANTTLNIGGFGDGAVVRLDNNNQIADTVVVNLYGIGSNAGILRLNGKTETVAALQSTGGQGIVENASGVDGYIGVNNTGVNRFDGVLRNGSNTGFLHFIKNGAGTQELTGSNIYTGSTTVNNGTLRILGANGQLQGTSELVIAQNGVFELYNSTMENFYDRLNDDATLRLTGGRFRLANDGGSGSYSETIGRVYVSGKSVIETQQAGSGGSSTLTIAEINRSNHGILQFVGAGLGVDSRNQIFIENMSSDDLDHGLIGAWAIIGDDFATYGANGVYAYNGYLTSGESAWAYTDNIKLNGSTTLSASRYVNSLKWEQTAASTIDLGGNTLRLESGGLILTGNYNAVVSNGTLTAGTGNDAASDLIIHQNTAAANQLDIVANITDNGTGKVTVVKSGQGMLVLSGDNSYTGGLVINEGTVKLNHANALPSTEDALTVQNGTLDLNGKSIAVGGLISYSNGVIVNNAASGNRATLTIGQGNANSSYNGVIQKGTGGVDLIKVGHGLISLNGANTIDGAIHIQQGTLRIGNNAALGETGAGKETYLSAGATLEIAAEGTYNETIYLEGDGFNGQGALVTKDAILRGGADQVRLMNIYLSGDTTINNYNKRVDFDGTFNAQGHALTKLGTSEVTFEGGAGIVNQGDLYIKAGKLIWGGISSWGNSTDDLVVFANASAEFYNVSLDQTKGIELRGGTLRRTGPAGSTTAGQLRARDGLKLKAGASFIAHSNSATVFHLGTIQREKGATLNLDNSTNLARTDMTNSNGIMGGWAVVGNNTWAVNSTNAAGGAITGLTTYETSTDPANWASSENVSLGANSTMNDAKTINSLRFTGSAALTMTVNEDLTITSGGILNANTAAVNINGTGTLRGSSNGELFVHQNSGQTMTIGVQIVNNGGPTALVKTGSGTLRLSGNNTYSGGTYISGSHGSVNVGTLIVDAISDTGTSSIGQSSGGSDNAIYFNRGRLQFNGNAETARDIHLLSGGGEFNISGSLTLSGIIHGEDLEDNEGFYEDQGILRITGGGQVTLSGSQDNTYTGTTYLDNGILILQKEDSKNAIGGNLVVAAVSEVYWEGSNQMADHGVLTINGGYVDLNGYSEKISGLVSTNEDSMIFADGADTSELEVEVNAGVTHEYHGLIEGYLKFIKTGEGTQILSGNFYHLGGTHIAEGVLQVGKGEGDETSNVGGAGLDGGSIQIDEGARLVINSASDYFMIEQDITGEGDFEQAGPGTTILHEDFQHIHTGNTYVTGGTLMVNSKVAVDPDQVGNVYVTGGKLAGNGVVNGHTVVKEFGTIEIGDPSYNPIADTLTINGDLTLHRSVASEPARLVFDVFAATYNDENLHTGGLAYSSEFSSLSDYYNSSNDALLGDNYTYDPNSYAHDFLIVEGTLTLDAGAKLVMNGASYLFQEGDVFHLLDWNALAVDQTVDGGWDVNADLILPELSEGLSWDRSLFMSHGIVTVIVPEPGRVMLLMIGMMAWITRRKKRCVTA